MSGVGRKICERTFGGPGGLSTTAGLRDPRFAGRTRATVRWGQNGRSRRARAAPPRASPSTTCACSASACGERASSANSPGRFPRGSPTGSGSISITGRRRVDPRERRLGDRVHLARIPRSEEDQRHVQVLRGDRPQRRVVEAPLPGRDPITQLIGQLQGAEQSHPRHRKAAARKGSPPPIRVGGSAWPEADDAKTAASDGDPVTEPVPAAETEPEGADRESGTWPTLKRTATEFQEDGMTDWAASLTYYGLLSLFPALIALVSLLGIFADPRETTSNLSEIVSVARPGDRRRHVLGPDRVDHLQPRRLGGHLLRQHRRRPVLGVRLHQRLLARVERDLRGPRGPARSGSCARSRSWSPSSWCCWSRCSRSAW